jgi:hypothetical protein
MTPPVTPSPSATPPAGTPGDTGGPGPADPTGRRDVPDRTADAQPPHRSRRELTDRALVAITAAVTLPVVWMGYGTDIDVTDVLASAETIREGDYIPSRPPGVPVFEAIVAVLDPVGGHLLVNLATALAGIALVVATARLVRAWGHPNGDLVALALLASPLTLISATSTADFVWAAAFFVVGTLALVRGRPVPAGLLFALAMGCRLSSALLVAAVLVAIAWEPAHRRPVLRAAAVAAPLTVALYVPAWLAYGGSSTMFETAEGWRSFGNNLGRFAYKDYAAFGLAFLVVLAVAAPAMVRALRRWNDDPMLRTGILCLVVSQAVFFVLPWKYNHLLPSVLAVLLWLAASDRNRRGFLWIVVGAIALNGLVTFRPLSPDNPAEAETGRWDPALSPGLVINDIRCRSDAMHHDPLPLNEGAWACTLEPLRGEVVDPIDDESQLSLRERYG